MNGFITPGNPLNVKYWINLQQLCWCFLHFGRELSPPWNVRGMGYSSHEKKKNLKMEVFVCSTLNAQPEGNGAAQQGHSLGDEAAAAAFQSL